MSIPSFITQNKRQVLESIYSLIDLYRPTFQDNNKLIMPAFDHLVSFIEKGKCVRGSLVLVGAEMYGAKKEVALRLAAAVEIIHSGLLIHDDIMDNDRLRRGNLTIFSQYEILAQKNNFSYPKEYGQSMAICIADICFFLAQNIISSLPCHNEIKEDIQQFISKELLYVGFAQMQDYEFACTPTMPTEAEILSLYTYKTGRYTFVLPLLSGALLSGGRISELKEMEKMAERFGILFQVKDDEIGMFSKDDISGKPQGSDIREGKKTLVYRHLLSKVNPEEKLKLESIFGKKQLTKVDLVMLQTLLDKYHIFEYSQTVIKTLADSISNSLNKLELPSTYKELFELLLEYSVHRTS